MSVNSSLLAPVLTVMSVVSLSLLSLMCLRCKRKSQIIQEESQIYNLQTFQRGGSKFAVVRSKTVTRPNPMSSAALNTRHEFHFPEVPTFNSNPDDNYIAPIAVSVYENDKSADAPPVYGNVFMSISMPDDDDDYENCEFLNQVMKNQELTTDESDYVNQGVTCS